MNPYVEAGYTAVSCSLGGYAIFLGVRSRQVRLRLAQLRASAQRADGSLEDA
ncbi:MAG: hypothetical protein ACYCWN_06110 [Ferrimicrobium sp.]|uniref:Heme exporter protein D n=1 Tax=Ferrimicrobium acidiphilum TaxID=121039 RepID=A0ABV3Y2Q5_9ACTN|nr:hypothetical protein [Ferrimicrobium sp.]